MSYTALVERVDASESYLSSLSPTAAIRFHV